MPPRDFDPRITEMIRCKAARLARAPHFRTRDEADLRQELALHVVRRLPRHDGLRASEVTYADRILTNKVIDLVRRARARCRDRFREETLEDPPARTLRQLHEHAGERARQEQLRHDLDDTLATLPDDERAVAVSLAEHSLVAVARLTGRSRQNARTARKRIRRHLEKAGWADGK